MINLPRTLLAAIALLAVAVAPASAECSNHVTIYLDRSGSMQGRRAVANPDLRGWPPAQAARSRAPREPASNFQRGVEIIGDLLQQPFFAKADVEVFLFDSFVSVPPARNEGRSSVEFANDLLSRSQSTTTGSTDLIRVINHLILQPPKGARHLFVIISDFEQDVKGNAEPGREAMAWQWNAKDALDRLRSNFVLRPRAELLLIHPTRSKGIFGPLRDAVVTSILTSAGRGERATFDANPRALADLVERNTPPLDLSVERRSGGNFLLKVTNHGCPDQEYEIAEARFKSLDESDEAKAQGLPRLRILPGAKDIEISVADQQLSFSRDAPERGWVYLYGRASRVNGRPAAYRRLDLPVSFSRKDVLEVRDARLKVGGEGSLEVEMHAAGQIVEAQSLGLLVRRYQRDRSIFRI